jgi:hypothetical protein
VKKNGFLIFSRAIRKAGRAKSGLIVDKPRFRYGSGLKKLKAHGKWSGLVAGKTD